MSWTAYRSPALSAWVAITISAFARGRGIGAAAGGLSREVANEILSLFRRGGVDLACRVGGPNAIAGFRIRFRVQRHLQLLDTFRSCRIAQFPAPHHLLRLS
jgi:hypothetical protein